MSINTVSDVLGCLYYLGILLAVYQGFHGIFPGTAPEPLRTPVSLSEGLPSWGKDFALVDFQEFPIPAACLGSSGWESRDGSPALSLVYCLAPSVWCHMQV